MQTMDELREALGGLIREVIAGRSSPEQGTAVSQMAGQIIKQTRTQLEASRIANNMDQVRAISKGDLTSVKLAETIKLPGRKAA